MAVQTQIQVRRGTASSWTSTNPTLAAGELGFETDTGKFKIGTGAATWTSLTYAGGGQNTLTTYQYTATSGQTTFSGVDSNGNTLSYTVGNIQVYLNGVLLVDTAEYTATSGTSIVLGTGAVTGDSLTVTSLGAFTVSSDIPKSTLTAKGSIVTATAGSTPANLSVGANGTVLTADSAETSGLKWATPASGGMTLISTTTLSGATTTLSSIPQTYNSLFLIISGVTANTGDEQIRVMLNNSTNAASIAFQYNATNGQTANGRIELSRDYTTRTDDDNAWSLRIDNYTSTTQFKPINYYGRYVAAPPANQTINAGGAFTDVTAITSIVFDYGGTNTFAGGTVLLYGVK
jgi:hypothetical protein